MVKIPAVGGYFDTSMLVFISFLLFFSMTSPVKVSAEQEVGNVHQSKQITKDDPKILGIGDIAVEPAVIPDVKIPPVTENIPPLVYKIPTAQPIVFLTIDDGSYKDQSVIDLLVANNIKATIFLAQDFVKGNTGFFQQLSDKGYPIENHTITHDLWMTRRMNKQQQAAEICGMADYEQQNFGRRPIFFRPPGGAYNGATMIAAGECGMRAVVTWTAEARGGVMYYQDDNKLKPGDIVLMHFRPEFAADLQSFIDAQNAAGLKTDLLENWL